MSEDPSFVEEPSYQGSEQVIPVARLRMPYSLVDHLTAHMAREKPIKSDPSGFYHPSAASVETFEDGERKVLGTCLRQAYYDVEGSFPRTGMDPYVLWTTYLGNAVEKMLREMTKESGTWVANSVRFHNREFNLSGELDLICKEPDGPEFIVEIKSFWGYEATKEIIGNRWKAGKPKDSHLLQVLVYLFLFKDRFPYAKMVYVARDSAKRKEFKITLDQIGNIFYAVIDGRREDRFTVNDIFARFQLLHQHVLAKDLPAREFELVYSEAKVEALWKAEEISKTAYAEWKKGKRKIGDWNCKWCKFKEACWGKDSIKQQDNEEIDIGD